MRGVGQVSDHVYRGSQRRQNRWMCVEPVKPRISISSILQGLLMACVALEVVASIVLIVMSFS